MRNVNARAGLASGMDPGQPYMVIVHFTVDTTGEIMDVKAEFGSIECRPCVKEAIRVVKASPRWLPAIENGRRVRSTQKQSISLLN